MIYSSSEFMLDISEGLIESLPVAEKIDTGLVFDQCVRQHESRGSVAADWCLAQVSLLSRDSNATYGSCHAQTKHYCIFANGSVDRSASARSTSKKDDL